LIADLHESIFEGRFFRHHCLGRDVVTLIQYSTATGSRLRHRYQVATVRPWFARFADFPCFAAYRFFLHPGNAGLMALSRPRSSTGHTFGLSRWKIRNISAVQRPMPRHVDEFVMMASSSMRASAAA